MTNSTQQLTARLSCFRAVPKTKKTCEVDSDR